MDKSHDVTHIEYLPTIERVPEQPAAVMAAVVGSHAPPPNSGAPGADGAPRGQRPVSPSGIRVHGPSAVRAGGPRAQPPGRSTRPRDSHYAKPTAASPADRSRPRPRRSTSPMGSPCCATTAVAGGRRCSQQHSMSSGSKEHRTRAATAGRRGVHPRQPSGTAEAGWQSAQCPSTATHRAGRSTPQHSQPCCVVLSTAGPIPPASPSGAHTANTQPVHRDDAGPTRARRG